VWRRAARAVRAGCRARAGHRVPAVLTPIDHHGNVLAATLAKDQWWFIVATALGQAVITLLAVFLGARWALNRESTSRHRAQAEDAARKLVDAIERLMVPLAHLTAYPAMVHGDPASAALKLRDLRRRHLPRPEGRLTEGSFLLDDDLRHAVQTASFLASIINEVLDGAELADWDAFDSWSAEEVGLLSDLVDALGAVARGHEYKPVAVPPTVRDGIFSTIMIRFDDVEAGKVDKSS
jgi:hypothetical protein